MEVRRGGHWRLVEHGAKGADGYELRLVNSKTTTNGVVIATYHPAEPTATRST